MKYIINRKYIMVALSVLLVVAGVINRNYKQPANEQTTKILGEAAYVNNDVKVVDNTSSDNRAYERERARDEAKEILEEIIENPATTEEGRRDAENQMINMAKYIKYEADCEMLLRDKGFINPVVTIADNSASVRIDVKDIMGTEIAQIVETVSSVTGIEADKIKILSGD